MPTHVTLHMDCASSHAVIHLLDESDKMKKEAADLKQRHIDVRARVCTRVRVCARVCVCACVCVYVWLMYVCRYNVYSWCSCRFVCEWP